MSENKLRAVAYIRVATESQLDGEAIWASQSTSIQAHAKCKSMQVVGEVRACEKGITMERPGWRDALQLAAREGANAICVKDLSRVARGAEALEQAIADLKRQHLQLITCDQSFMDAKLLLEVSRSLFSMKAANAKKN